MGIAGIISDHKGSVARDVMITLEEWQAMKKQVEADLAANPAAVDQGKLFEEGSGAAMAAADSAEATAVLEAQEESSAAEEEDEFPDAFQDRDDEERG